ncbi:MAG TPA: septum formation initiator family protein [Candidatus Methylacidiphilales bacterium]|jgi:cell division protein FtsB|nr:septum formation initiator family protein [Candidatus Methylacidiphilales bacterium]
MPSPRFLDPSSIPLKRQSGGNIWATLVPIIQISIVIGLLAVVGLFFLPVIQTENSYKTELAGLESQISDREEEQARLNLEIKSMINDPVYVEHIARDQLNMGKPGETIVRFDDRYQPAPLNSQSTAALPDDGSN